MSKKYSGPSPYRGRSAVVFLASKRVPAKIRHHSWEFCGILGMAQNALGKGECQMQERYEKVAALWQSWNITTDAQLAQALKTAL